MAEKKPSFRFSIIIPLEFHRGQSEECLRRWVKEQDYLREQFEVVAVGCRFSLDLKTIAYFKTLLSEYDRLLLFDEPHDMALCAFGARQAQGEILFFTESHVLPDRNILSVADKAIDEHPDWAGFSCRSIRITHNRLSVIEADMYEADLLYGMNECPWRKILDQCFVVRAGNYHKAGGFNPELGHFAEWHLAARMHQNGYQIGYVPEAQVHHYYIGEIKELIKFSEDFARGEMTYLSKFKDDESRSYFPDPLEWLDFYRWNSRLYNKAFRLSYNAHSKSFRRCLSPREIFARGLMLLRLSFPFETLKRTSLTHAWLRFQVKRWLLTLLLNLRFGKSYLHTQFLQLIDATVKLERVRFAFDIEEKPSAATSSLRWSADEARSYPFGGFYASEEWQGKRFRWSEPVAMIEISLVPGNYDLEIDWLMAIRPIENLKFYINEKPMPVLQERAPRRISFQVNEDAPTRFALTCEPWLVPKDKRLLGVPVSSVTITPRLP